MTAEEIRQRAIECADQYNVMCALADDCCVREDGSHCPYYSTDTTRDCTAVYGYERGFADGIEEGKKQSISQGHWVGVEYDGYADGNPVYDAYECSVCGEEHYGEEDTLTQFCPYCGARMDEEGEQNDE